MFQIHYTLLIVENDGGVVMKNIRKLETKLPKPDAEKITKKVSKTVKNLDKHPSNSLNTSNPRKAEGKNAN